MRSRITRKTNFLSVFSFNLDPSIRYTVWSIVIGNSLHTTSVFSCLQTQAQRYMCVKDTKAAQRYVSHEVPMYSMKICHFPWILRVAWISYVLCVLILLMCGCVGCIIYAKYSQCDPLQAKLISKPDQVSLQSCFFCFLTLSS
jgi:hypothetical protein